MPLRFILLAAIIALNAFFAAAEVALVSVRRSRLKELASRGSVGARASLELLSKPERLLSLTQVGVTLASLGLGWAGEDTLYQVFLRALGPVITPHTAAFLHGASFALGFLAMSFFHVVVGEVVPKNLAMEKADRLALLVAPALLVFYRVFEPFIYVVERTVAGLSRMLGLRGRGV
ncbi:MAG TPA: CNNM domain-containing protein, partial [Bryobacteraceae bacterium]|nr:CNNM domain-containing protein [Bryobacteraceae bacterium]